MGKAIENIPHDQVHSGGPSRTPSKQQIQCSETHAINVNDKSHLYRFTKAYLKFEQFLRNRLSKY